NLQEGKLKKFCQKIRENSVKYKNKRAVDINQIKQIAFNGASDIHLLHVTNAMDKKLLDNIKQDCWLVTMDKKLAAFCDLFHQIRALLHKGLKDRAPLEDPNLSYNSGLRSA
ncbi:hypothetical protein QDR98_11620, partial [Acinetobacter baumannii]|nr:hypothetical protein [Acinetobacter baumannii]